MTSSRYFRKALCGIASVALLALGLAACSDAVSFNDSTEAPKVGSSYRVALYHYDSNGRVIRMADTLRVAVLPTLAQFLGRAAVVPFAMLVHGNPDDTLYLRYEPNGDISYVWPRMTMSRPGTNNVFVIPESWVRLPFGGKTIGVHTLLDTAYTYQQGSEAIPVAVTIKVITQFLGPDPIVTEQGPLNTVKVEAKHEITTVVGTLRQQTVFAHLFWYSPKLGALVQEDVLDLRDAGDGKGLQQRQHDGWTIQAYSLGGGVN
jgi:hypothetical protein